MKVFKKLLAVIVAFVMSLVVVVFAGFGCNEDNSGNNGDDTNTTNPGDGDSTGDGNTENPGDGDSTGDGNTETPGDGTETPGDGTETPGGVHSKVENILTEILTPVAAAQFEITHGDTDNISGKFNFAEGNADFVIVSESEEEDEGGILYEFVRGWNMFTYKSAEEVTDWSDITLEYGGGMFGNEIPELAQVVPMLYSVLPAVNYPVLILADATDSITFEGDTATVDLNKLVYTEIGWAKNLLSDIDNDTTVAGLLENENLRKILEPLLGKVTAAQLNAVLAMVDVETLPQEIQPVAAAVLDLLTKVQPDANSTTYSYLIKLIKSKELNKIVNDALGMTLPCDLADLKLGFVIDMVSQMMPPSGGENMPDVPNVDDNNYENPSVVPPSDTANYADEEEPAFDVSMLADMLEAALGRTTAEKLVFVSVSDMSNQIPGGTMEITTISTTEVSGLSITYKLNGNRIAEQTVAGEYATSAEVLVDGEPYEEMPAQTNESDFSAHITFADTAFELTDISENAAVYYEYTYNGTHEGEYVGRYGSDDDYEQRQYLDDLRYSIEVTFENGEFTLTQNGEPVGTTLTAGNGVVYYIDAKLNETAEGSFVFVMVYASEEDKAASLNPVALWYAPVKEGDVSGYLNECDFSLRNIADTADLTYNDGVVSDLALFAYDGYDGAISCDYDNGKLTVTFTSEYGTADYEYYVKVVMDKDYYNEELGPNPWVCIFESAEDAETCHDHYDAYLSIRLDILTNTVTTSVAEILAAAE